MPRQSMPINLCGFFASMYVHVFYGEYAALLQNDVEMS
jgi:hypothetical protein